MHALRPSRCRRALDASRSILYAYLLHACLCAAACRWYNTQDPLPLLAKNPKLLLNVEEADLEADPLYGEAATTRGGEGTAGQGRAGQGVRGRT